MIKDINRIKNLGVFGDYSKHAQTKPFAERNIIYGWNYSGKTTFSRVFHCLESKALHQDYPGFTFSIDSGTQHHITEVNLHSHNKVVRVFNTDFVNRNISWDGDTFEPILLLGEESIEMEKEIIKIQNGIQRCRDGYKKKAGLIKALDLELAEKKKKTAQQIKTTLAIIETFNAVHLDKLLVAVELGGVGEYILPSESIPERLKSALSSEKDKLDTIQKIVHKTQLKQLYEQCKISLEKIPNFSSVIEYFKNNPQVANWVEQGLPLHEQLGKCKFCGNELDVQRMDVIKAHFSKDLSNYRSELEGKLTLLNQATLKLQERAKGLFYPHLRENASKQNLAVKTYADEVNNEINKLIVSINKKLSAPFEKIELPNISLDCEENLGKAIEDINATIDVANNITVNFKQEKEKASSALRLHYASNFLATENPLGIERKKNIFSAHMKKYQTHGELLKQVVADLEAKINQAQMGREVLNDRIEELLGSDAIKIKVLKDGEVDKFQLVRGDEKAKNLSEGEKTAIAFSYFLSKLKEEKNLKEVIVYIDDPISSLDSNHIFQVNAIIRNMFIYKDYSEDAKNGKWRATCKQLFISTHNFEFLTLLKRMPGSQNYYHIKRTGKSVSGISNLSEAITRFQSEYHYLYSLIRDFHHGDDKANIERLLSIPNAVRRFVELYTMARLPSKFEVDTQVEELFGIQKATRILKVLHNFSHLNNIDRLISNTDLISDIENAVSDLFELIKADDPRHLAALEDAIS